MDLGFAVLAYYIVNLWSKRSQKLEKFLPPWYDVPLPDPNQGALRLFELAKQSMAERGLTVADDQHTDG